MEPEQGDCNSALEKTVGSLLEGGCNYWNLSGKWVVQELVVLVGYNQMKEEREHCKIAEIVLVGYNQMMEERGHCMIVLAHCSLVAVVLLLLLLLLASCSSASLLASDIHLMVNCKLMEIAWWALCRSLRQVELQNLNKI